MEYVLVIEMSSWANMTNSPSRHDASRDAHQTQQHNTSEASIRGISNELSLHSTSLQNHVSEKVHGISASLTTMASGNRAADQHRVEESRQLCKSLEQISVNVTNHLNQSEQAIQQQMQSNSEQISSRFDEMHSMSTNQSQVIIGLLHQIQGCLNSKSSAACTTDRKPIEDVENTLDDLTSEDGVGILSTAVDRLCRFATKNTTVYHSDEAEEIIDDLEQIINALLEHDAKIPHAADSGRKRKCPDDSGEPDVPYEIKKIRGIVTASRAIEVGGSQSKCPRGSNQARSKQIRQSTKIFGMTDCTAVVSVKSGSYSQTTRMSCNETGSVLSALNYLQGNISLLPTHSTKPVKISASFIQQLTCSGFSSPYPRLAFHPIVPEDAEIFHAVNHGDVSRMVELLDCGEASLLDCDSEGRSLLSVCHSRSGNKYIQVRLTSTVRYLCEQP